jgi:hypothetical protein
VLRNISLSWTEVRAPYAGRDAAGKSVSFVKHGETVSFSAEFFNGTVTKVSASWRAILPDRTETKQFQPAPIEIRDAYIPWLTKDQTALAQVAIVDKNANFRDYALSQLTDQTAIARVAAGDPNIALALHAIAKLSDEATLTEIATTGYRPASQDTLDRLDISSVYPPDLDRFFPLQDVQVRIAAIHKLTDQASLAKIATAVQYPEFELDDKLRMAAVDGLTDPAILAKIASSNDCYDTLRAEAAERLRKLSYLPSTNR